MDLLIVTGIFPPDVGGPATYVPAIAGQLAKRGHGVTVVTLSDGAAHDDGRYPFPVIRVARGGFKPVRLLRTVLTLLRLGRRAQVLFVNGLPLEAALANALLRKPLVQKVVGDWAWERARNRRRVTESFEAFQENVHGPGLEIAKALRNFCLRRADLVIVPSRYLARCVERWGVRARKVRVIYNAAAPPEPVPPLPPPLETRYTLVTVGRLVSWKGLDGLLPVLRALGDDVGLLVVGDGPEGGRLRELARSLGIEHRVRFLGRLDQRQVPAVLAACDLLVLNSSYEGLPHVVLEAMRVGVPVVATDVGGTDEVLAEKGIGLLVPPGDPGALERAIRQLLTDPDRRRELARLGCEAAVERFSIERMGTETEAVLVEAVTQGAWSWRADLGGLATRARRRISRGFLANVAALTLANVVSSALALAQAIIVARALGPQLYGVAALIMTYPGFLFGLLDARSGQASLKYLGEFGTRQEAARALAVCRVGYVLDFVIASLTFLAAAATAGWAEEHVVRTPGVAGLVVLYAAAFLPRSLVATSRAVLATLGRFALLGWLRALTAALEAVLVIALVSAGYGLAGVIWGNAVAAAAEGVLVAVPAHRLIKRTWQGSWLQGSWAALSGRRRELLRFLFYSDLSELLAVLTRQLDVLALGYFQGPTETGYYRLAKSLSKSERFVVEPLQSVAYARLAALYGTGDDRQPRRFVFRLALGVGVPAMIVALAVPFVVPAAVRALFGDAFAGAIVPAQIALVGGAIQLGLFWIRPLYLAAGRVASWFAMGLLNAAMAVIAYPVSAALWGATGMASARVVVSLLRYGIAFIPMRSASWRAAQAR